MCCRTRRKSGRNVLQMKALINALSAQTGQLYLAIFTPFLSKVWMETSAPSSEFEDKVMSLNSAYNIKSKTTQFSYINRTWTCLFHFNVPITEKPSSPEILGPIGMQKVSVNFRLDSDIISPVDEMIIDDQQNLISILDG